LDITDKKILNILQTTFPISKTPFKTIGLSIGITGEEVIGRILTLKRERVIRQISAIFDSHNIGYKSTLAAFKVSDNLIDTAANILNAHEGVSHNYLRDNPYNIWFTITLPQKDDLKKEIELLNDASNAADYIILPTIKLFKIGVNFDMTGEDNTSINFFSHNDFKEDSEIFVSDFEKKCIKELQKDLEIVDEPFEIYSDILGVSQEELLKIISKFIAEKKMRRFACVLYHQKAGFSYNIMGIWKSKEEDIEKNGKLMSGIKEVSHCYQRAIYPGKWEYNIFTMMHTKSEEEAHLVMKNVSELTGIKDYASLRSIKEFKKVRVKYYT
jgi:DNA-binding Lrp family transcriptional regulator